MTKQLLLTLFVLSILGTQAQWKNRTATNNLVCGTSPTTGKFGNVSTTDGAGGMIIAWIDSRDSASKSIYAQRILSDGTLKFTQEVLISNATGDSSSYKANLVIVSDSAGGAILAWQDARNTTATNLNTDVYGQRIDGNGNVLWAKDGVRLSLVGNSQSNKISALPVLVNKNEFIFIFGDNRNGTSDLFAQKVSVKDGSLLWASDVSLHGSQPGVQTVPVALSDGKGGAFVVWQDPRQANTNADIYGQYIDNTGKLYWGTSGLGICTAKNQQLTPRIVSDGEGGIVVTWSDQRAAVADGNIYAQRVSAAGLPIWTADGLLVCDFTGNQSVPNIIKGGNGYIIEWTDARKGSNDKNIFAQSIDTNGITKWTTATAGGVPVCQATGNQPYNNNASGIKLEPDGKKGAYVIWDDSRNTSSNVDIYGQHIDSLGVLVTGWAADGNAICNALNSQQTPCTELDESFNVIVAWRDSRDSLNAIYASKLSPNGSLVLPLHFISANAGLINNSVHISWKTTQESLSTNYEIEYSADGVSFTVISTTKATGSNSYSYVNNSPATGSNYYRIHATDKLGYSVYSSVVKVVVGQNAKLNIVAYPNPVLNSLSLSFNNFSKANYTISLLSINGRPVKQLKVNLDGTSNMQLETFGLAEGTYILRVTDSTGSVLLSKLIIKQ